MAVLLDVDRGSAVFGSGATSLTVAVPSYTAAQAIVFFSRRGGAEGGTTAGIQNIRCTKASSTSLQFDRNSSGETINIEWEIRHFDSDVDVQDVSATSGATNYAISAVTLAQSFVQSLGLEVSGSSFGDNDTIAAEITTTTNLNTLAGFSPANSEFQVVDYTGCATQFVETVINNDTSVDAAISAVTMADTILCATRAIEAFTTSVFWDEIHSCALSSPTTVHYQSDTAAAFDQTLRQYVVEFSDGFAGGVQRGSVFQSSPTLVSDVTIALVNPAQTMTNPPAADNMNSAHNAEEDDGDFNHANWTLEITSPTNLHIERDGAFATGDSGNIEWELAEFEEEPPPTPSGCIIVRRCRKGKNVMLSPRVYLSSQALPGAGAFVDGSDLFLGNNVPETVSFLVDYTGSTAGNAFGAQFQLKIGGSYYTVEAKLIGVENAPNIDVTEGPENILISAVGNAQELVRLTLFPQGATEVRARFAEIGVTGTPGTIEVSVLGQ